MASCSWRIESKTWKVFTLTTPDAVAELGKMLAIARQEAEADGVDTKWDDWCTVESDDECVRLRYEMRDTTR